MLTYNFDQIIEGKVCEAKGGTKDAALIVASRNGFLAP